MSKYRIAIIPGDGVGPEIIAQVTKVIDALNRKFSCNIEVKTYPYCAEYYLRTRITIPDQFIDELKKNFHAVFVGPLGDPRIPDNRHGREIIFNLRQRLNLSLNINIARLYQDWLCPLKDLHDKNMNFLIIKENLESSSNMIGSYINQGKDGEAAFEANIYTSIGVEKFIREALALSRQTGRKRVCLVDKSNVFSYSHGIFQSAMEKVALDFPDITTSSMSIDLALVELIQNPVKFDVILTTGLFGDILFQVATTLTGGHGLAWGCEICPNHFGMYRVLQSSAPKFAGHDRSNPLGAILALSYLLKQLELFRESTLVEKAVQDILFRHFVTLDLNGMIGTEEVGYNIVDFIQAN